MSYICLNSFTVCISGIYSCKLLLCTCNWDHCFVNSYSTFLIMPGFRFVMNSDMIIIRHLCS